MMPAFTTAPLSTLEAGTGAAAWASGIHTCSGTRPALMPKPATSSARIVPRCGEAASVATASSISRPRPRHLDGQHARAPTSSTDSASSAIPT